MVKFTYELIDALALHHAHPDTFKIPSPAMIASLKPGDFAKIGVRFAAADDRVDGERFWVKVTEADADSYVGEVDNALLYTDAHGLDRGDMVHFGRRNILSIM
jgi:hypothetical protein